MNTSQRFLTAIAGMGFAAISAMPASADLLVDFEELNDDNNTLPTGFVSIADLDDTPRETSYTFTGVAAAGVGTSGTVDITVATTGDSPNGLRFFDRAAVTTSGDDLDGLARDFLFTSKFLNAGSGPTNDVGIIITLSGVAAGTYTFTGFFHDNNNDQGVVDVYVDTGSGEVLGIDDAAYTTGTSIATVGSGSVEFTADGVNDVVFRVVNPNTSGNGSHLINGFTIVPEPSSLALIGLGGLLIARRRR